MGAKNTMTFDNRLLRVFTIGAVLVAMGAVTGCREEEQHRPLTYDKGTYQGKPDQQLTDAQRQELRSRARSQAF